MEKTYQLGHLGKHELIAELYRRYGKKLYSYAIHSWKLDEDSAWELAYKTLYKVIDTYTRYAFESEEKFASFIFKIFINYLRNHYRATRKTERPVSIDTIQEPQQRMEAESSSEEGIQNPKLKLLNETLEGMEDWQRMLLLMRSDGRTYSEIAAFIDKPEDQLKVYYQRLKEQISKKLHERK